MKTPFSFCTALIYALLISEQRYLTNVNFRFVVVAFLNPISYGVFLQLISHGLGHIFM